jgi:hypothetical protein
MTGKLDWRWIGIGVAIMLGLSLGASLILALERAARWLGRSVVVFSRWRRGPCPERTHLICAGGW